MGRCGWARDSSHITCSSGSLDVIKARVSKIPSFYIETNVVSCTFINLHFKIYAGKDLLSTYYAHIAGLGDGRAETYNKQDAFPDFLRDCRLVGETGKHRNNTKGYKGARQVMNVGFENGSSKQKFLILSISVTVHMAFISFAKGRIKIP